MTYSARTSSNSNRSRGYRQQFNARRRLAGLTERDFDADPLVSIQVVRDSGGHRLPFQFSPQLLRAWRSKYQPHVGAKQRAKAGR